MPLTVQTPGVPSYPDDLNDAVPGSATPLRSKTSGLNAKRRQTILSLIDALSQLNEDDHHGPIAEPGNPSSFDDDRDVPTVDEHLQVVGAESFHRFQKRINNLDKELEKFLNATRQLGSSVGILSSAFHLRTRLAHLHFLVRENAADLFPRKISRTARSETVVETLKKRRRKAKRNPPPNVRRPVVDEKLDPECFPEQFEGFANDLITFLNCLNEFPEFMDESVNSAILAFELDLKYWASCLKDYKSQFRYPAVQRYIHDLSAEMGEHMDSITSKLSTFIEIGVPTIRFAQKHSANNLLNLSTVAIFFSAVTATTLQFSYNLPRGSYANAVNSFWFASLVFSIAAAVNSLLGLTWKQAIYRSPRHQVPWWVSIWIKRSPLVFLVLSVACFSVGLVLFTHAAGMAPVTATITSVLTAFTSFGLVAVSAWFATEQRIYLRHGGKKWLGDILTEIADRFVDLPGLGLLKRFRRWTKRRSLLKRFRRWTQKGARNTQQILPRPGTLNLTFFSGQGTGEDGGGEAQLDSLVYSPTTVRSPLSEHASPSSEARMDADGSADGDAKNAEAGSGRSPDAPKSRFASAVRSVIMLQSASPGPGPLTPRSPTRQRTTSTGESQPDAARKRTTDPMTTFPNSRVASLIPRLQSLEQTQDLAAHSALVRHLQFSPNGKFLATSSWDRTATIFHVGDPFTPHRTLAHPQGFVGQVAWSPSGNLLLTRLYRGVKVWTEDGVCKKTIDRLRAVESITWFPGGEAFLCVEGGDVVKMDLHGKMLDTYKFDRMKIHDVAVTPDSQRILAVGPLLSSPTGLQPSTSRVEKRLVVYNLDSKLVENQTPVLNDVRDITVARNGLVALISYENKAPPQLWRLELVRDRENSGVTTGRLTLRHTYMPKVPVDFAGPSYFGGKDDQLVLCAGKAGDIHIWDRDSGALLHHIQARALGGDLTSVAWNYAVDNPFMFATGSHDGAVRIFTTPYAPSHTSDGHGGENRGRSTSRVDTASSFGADVEYRRTDSPVTIRDGDVQFGHDTSSPQNEFGTPNRNRSVVFATPEAAVDTSPG